QLVRHPWRLEHREGVRALVLTERDHPGGEQGELVLGRPGVHVDDAAGGVGVDREAELAEAVDDLRLAVLVLEFLGELGGPVREVLDLREVAEHDVLRRVEDGGDGAVDHACSLVWYRTNRYDIRLAAPGTPHGGSASPAWQQHAASDGARGRWRVPGQARWDRAAQWSPARPRAVRGEPRTW